MRLAVIQDEKSKPARTTKITAKTLSIGKGHYFTLFLIFFIQILWVVNSYQQYYCKRMGDKIARVTRNTNKREFCISDIKETHIVVYYP